MLPEKGMTYPYLSWDANNRDQIYNYGNAVLLGEGPQHVIYNVSRFEQGIYKRRIFLPDNVLMRTIDPDDVLVVKTSINYKMGRYAIVLWPQNTHVIFEDYTDNERKSVYGDYVPSESDSF